MPFPAGRVVAGSQFMGGGPIYDGFDAPPEPACGFVLGAPDRRQNAFDVGSRDAVDRVAAYDWRGIVSKGVLPLLHVLTVLLLCAMGVNVFLGAFVKGLVRRLFKSPFGLRRTFLGEGVFAIGKYLPVGLGFGPSTF